MSAGSFLVALAALSIGTYLMRFAGVKLGGAIAMKGRRRSPAAASVKVGDASSGENVAGSGKSVAVAVDEPADSTERVTKWMDRATVVLIGAVFGLVWAWLGYKTTRGERDFTSVSQVVASRYEVLTEHKHVERARELLAELDPLRAAQEQVRRAQERARAAYEREQREQQGRQQG